MPASYSQRSAQLRADRQAKAGWSSLGDNPDMFIIDGDGNVRLKVAQGFDLPDLAPGNEEWVSDVVLWWTSLRYSPQALLLNTGVAWATALVAAGALNTYYVTGMAPYLSQWRSLTSGFGLTPADLRKIRTQIVAPGDELVFDDEDTDDEVDEEIAALEASL